AHRRDDCTPDGIAGSVLEKARVDSVADGPVEALREGRRTTEGPPMSDPQRVFVYRSPDPNAPTFAVRDLATGTVVERDEVWLADATFEVSPSGRYRSIQQKRRTVHAGVFGTLLNAPPTGKRCDVPVRYKPKESSYFLNEEHRPVHSAEVVHLIHGKAYVRREV